MATQAIASASVTLDASGSGLLRFGPAKYSERWKITRLTTRGTAVAVLTVYRGAVGGQMVDSSKYADRDVSETTLELGSGEFITVQYTGGTTGAVMSFHIEGEISYGV